MQGENQVNESVFKVTNCDLERFHEDFMFQLTKKEYEKLRCQSVTAIKSAMSRSIPHAFTEQGIYMLATVLRGELAEQQSIFIMRAFSKKIMCN